MKYEYQWIRVGRSKPSGTVMADVQKQAAKGWKLHTYVSRESHDLCILERVVEENEEDYL